MESKIGYALKKCRPILIVIAILWLALTIVFVVPVTVSWVNAIEFGEGSFIETLIDDFGNIGENLKIVFTSDYINTFLKLEMYLLIILLFCGIVGMIKTIPKNDYKDIEHGSSDWAKGEQYSVLSKNKGILLAEKHYLPVDKRGNVNVLVVGRFWIW